MSRVVFLDTVSPLPYDSHTFGERAVQGTEASVMRIADAIGAWVMQHNRTEDRDRYLRMQPLGAVEHVVVIREARALARARELFPAARLHLWLHDKMRPGTKRGRRLRAVAPLLRQERVGIVCVSDTHRRDVLKTLGWAGIGELPVCTRYNPLDPSLQPDGTPFDERQLVFFSSPNKGLAFTLDAFGALRRAMPELRLIVGNPGYKADHLAALPGVKFLGPQPQAVIHAHVRQSLCAFQPNFRIPETFGLVYAESHALGTPVLTHDFGAAAEVVADPRQLLPVKRSYRCYEGLVGTLRPRWRRFPARLAAGLGLFDAYVERIRDWRSGARPVAGPDPRFALATVAAQWRELFAP
ncbi:MAG TPA: glycosyltransferase [Steroidobacteraceae bacterium]|nr:glycosyltransferase [Steroidobacteraceae bacterium]